MLEDRSHGREVSLRIVLHSEIPEDPELHRQWNDLALQTERPEVFYACEWALAVQHSYRAFLKPLLFLGYEGDRLIGVASLANNAVERRVGFLAATTGDYCEFLSEPRRRAEFVDAVFAELGKTKADSIALTNLPENSATPSALLAAARRYGFHLHMRPAYLCAQVEMGSDESRRELKAALLNKKKLRRYLRAMEREGPVSVSHLQSPAEIAAAMPAFTDAHVARFQATQRTSSLSTPERRLFLEELIRRFSGQRVVTLSTLTIGNRPVAWNFGFQFHGSWFWYQPTFDSSQEENSPGHCLLSRIVMQACDMDGIEIVDLGLGAEGYKERFGNSTRQTLYVAATKSWPRHLQVIVKYRVANWVKQSPRIESAVRRIRSRFQPARQVASGTKKHLD
jgi:CelD/BcsL family acetyltransferase involved in cellulose biosynthesis